MLNKTTLAPLLLLGVWIASFSQVRGEIVEYTSGHADIGLALEGPGQLFLHYHFGVGSAILNGVPATAANEELAPSNAYVRVSDVNLITLPAFDFLGNTPSSPIWMLPGTNTPGVPYLGIASEELDPMQFTSAGFRLTSFSGPVDGSMAIFQFGAGSPNVFMRSNDGVNPAIDVIPSTVGGHDHFNYAFSKPGIYDLGIEGFATSLGGTLTDPGIFRFVVGSATAVPEPSSFLLLVAFGIPTILRRYRCLAIS
jgi:surface-anchored protein